MKPHHDKFVKDCTNIKTESVAANFESENQPAALSPLSAALDIQQQKVHPQEPRIDSHPMMKAGGAWLRIQSEATRHPLLQQPEERKTCCSKQ